jgi:membrane protein
MRRMLVPASTLSADARDGGAVARWIRSVGERLAGSTLGETFLVAYSTRLMGLAAEASYWGLFALPWLILGLTAGMFQVESWLGVDAITAFREQVLDVASRVLTPEAIDELLIPMLDDLLAKGSTALGLLGVAIAIWAGSRVIDTLVDAMTIVYQREGLRSYLVTRLVGVGVYVAGLLGLIVVIPLLVAGPTFVARMMPGVDGGLMAALLVVAQVVVILVLVVSLYHWSVPHRTPWIADIPGALVAMALWVVLSVWLRLYFGWVFRDGSVYGVISAPIAIMLWVFMTNLAVLLGAAFNSALAVRRGWFSRPAPPVEAASPVEG